MKFFVVRHGETDWNKLGRFQGHTDISLNDRGLSQARETAVASEDWGYTAIYSSPLVRTVQVAEEIAKVTPMLVSQEPGLKELSLGDLEGVTGEEMRNDWPDLFAAWRTEPEKMSMPNGESLGELRDRTWQVILDIEQKHSSDDSIVVISHNFAIRSIVNELLGMPLAYFHRMSLNLASVCTFDSDERGRRLTGYNSTSHLSPENR
ncbi:MAG: histidine phosphatase family protein [Dehalococcoidia bacterium]|nr:histidine phosphatase family protein [Dehalococcoidia bacterium]